ncbi:hypothetical protein [Pseudooceanicola lipolyticus]|uniref:hypothetical protein n=1 Tax=Pseudooceanicola TaxID=1679449 RepID=UPI00155F44C7|nr:hypothetical protein [Pseudooceanicola lipolyticus]
MAERIRILAHPQEGKEQTATGQDNGQDRRITKVKGETTRWKCIQVGNHRAEQMSIKGLPAPFGGVARIWWDDDG